MAHNTIAVISDCDDTLAPDTTVQLLRFLGIDPKRFFSEDVAQLVADGWDPPLAYLTELVRQGRTATPRLSRSIIEEVGRGLTFFPGIPECLQDLKKEIEGNSRYRDFGIRAEFYVISGGIEEMIAASPLGPALHGLWGCSFAYDAEGNPLMPKRVLSFTDKTRYIFNIQKGKVAEEFRSRPYVVNEPMDEIERPVPFKNMIYIGDGPSDIPCMSLLQKEGYVIGILSDDNPHKTWALAYGRRAHITVPPDFRPDQHGFKHLRQAIIEKAEAICQGLSASGPVPSH
jgi:hypothetical protein